MPLGRRTSSAALTKRDIENVFVTGFEKRRKPRKHYVYVMVVSWTDHSRYEIYRRYSDFFSFQSTLLQLFPAEAKDKIIPSLPKRIFIGRSHVASVAEARVDAINSYCQRLVTLDEKIAGNIHVLTFFGPLPGDKQLEKLELGRPASLHPLKIPTGSLWEEHLVVANFEKDSEQQLSVEVGAKVIVVNKDESGWWLVQDNGKSGWVPAAYLNRCSKVLDENNGEDSSNYLGFVVEDTGNNSDLTTSTSPSFDAEQYRAIADYDAQENGQLSFEENQLIHVIDKMEDGWWFVSLDQKEGWVPCSYLEPAHNIQRSFSDIDSPSLHRSSPVLGRSLRASPPPTSSSSGHTSPDEQVTEGKYAVTESYIAQESDEISLPQGTVIDVQKKSIDGWWTISHKGQVGLFPAAFLQKHETESYFLQIKNRQSGHSFYNKAPPPRKRTVRKHVEKNRRKGIRRHSPRVMHVADKIGTCTSSSDSDNYRHCEIADRGSHDDSTFWGRKPVVSRMRSSSTNSDSSGADSGSRKGSRENTPDYSSDARKSVSELKDLFAKRSSSSDDSSPVRKSPVIKRRVLSDEKPVIVRPKPNLSSSPVDSPNIPSRPRQSEIFRAHFANAFTTTAPSNEKKHSPTSSMATLQEVQSELEASTNSVLSGMKPRKKLPPTPPRKENSPVRVRRRSNSAEPKSELPDETNKDDSVLQERAMEAILKALIQKNGPELQNLVKQAVASDPELLKMALSSNN